jgi:hypothetical protein
MKCSCDLFLRLEIVSSSNRAKIQIGLLFGNGLKNRKKNLFSPNHVGPKALCSLRPTQRQPGIVPRPWSPTEQTSLFQKVSIPYQILSLKSQFDPKPSRFSPLPPPPSSHQIWVSHIDSPLGGGAPAYTITVKEVLGAGAPQGGVPATVKDKPSRTIIASSPWTHGWNGRDH